MKKDTLTKTVSLLLVAVIILIILPLIIAAMMNFTLIVTDTSNAWIGFWESYLGAIVGAFVAIYVMKKTIHYESAKQMMTEKNQFLDDLTKEIGEYVSQINRCNCDLIRFHSEGLNKQDWNYEAMYGLNRAHAMESLLQIRLCSRRDILEVKEMQAAIVSIFQDTTDFHQKKYTSLDELKSDANKIGYKLEELLAKTAEFVSLNMKTI